MTDGKSFFAEHFPTLTTWALAVGGALIAGLRYLIIGPILSRLTTLEQNYLNEHDRISGMCKSVENIEKRLESMDDDEREQRRTRNLVNALKESGVIKD